MEITQNLYLNSTAHPYGLVSNVRAASGFAFLS